MVGRVRQHCTVMANNYTQFSCLLSVTNPAERQWWRHLLDTAEEETGLLGDLVGDDHVGFDAELTEDGVWFYSEESGCPEHVAAAVQAFFSRFRLDGQFGFEWAEWCDKPRLGEFGGGGCYVTTGEVRWLNTAGWLGEQH